MGDLLAEQTTVSPVSENYLIINDFVISLHNDRFVFGKRTITTRVCRLTLSQVFGLPSGVELGWERSCGLFGILAASTMATCAL